VGRAVGLLSLVGLAVAGVLSASVLAGTTPLGLLDTTIGSTGTGTTTTAAQPTIAAGVTIGTVAVGGMTADQARDAVETVFARPLVVVIARHWLAPKPVQLGAAAKIDDAVARAQAAAPGTHVPLAVRVARARVRAYVALLARRFDRKPVDAQLTLRRLAPFITKDVPGRSLERRRAVRTIAATLLANRRGPVRLFLRPIPPQVTRAAFGPVIVIRRGSNRLYLYSGMRLWRIFGVATGQPAYPTPLGRWQIVVKWRNPWWYPPPSPWARGEHPIPPGPGNPLGTRWMGLSASGVGIHGTPDAASIGYSASHGCIRMHIPEAEWLFDRVRIGTPVFIVAA
jgi:lipoprotein-anchoring transpeptidase ErfK/SrfK